MTSKHFDLRAGVVELEGSKFRAMVELKTADGKTTKMISDATYPTEEAAFAEAKEHLEQILIEFRKTMDVQIKSRREFTLHERKGE